MAETNSAYAFTLGSYWVWGTQLGALCAMALSLVFASARIPLWAPLLPVVSVAWCAALGDCLVAGLGSSSSAVITAAREPLYGKSASSCTYNPLVSGEGFDWHKAALEPNNFFFVDLSSLLYGFLLILSLTVLVYVALLGVLTTYLGTKEGPSLALRAVLIRAIEHSFYGALAGILVWAAVSLRIGMDGYAVGF